jgi:hypothetical protein
MMRATHGTGTIVAATTRKDFGIIAADRMWHDPDSGVTGTHRKIVLHPYLPVAIATMGRVRVPVPWHPTNRGRIRMNAFIKLIFAEIDRLDSTTIEFIKEKVKNLILPGVLRDRAEAETAEAAEKICVLLPIVMHFEISSHLYAIGLFDEMKFEIHESTISNPPCLDDLYLKHDRDTYGYYLGAGFESPSRIADRLKRSIEKGISAEADLNGGTNRLVGGGVDVAIVDERGARFLFKDSKSISA